MLQASPVRFQCMCVCASCCKDFRPGAYVSLMFMQLMLHKFATAGTRDRVERDRERGREGGTAQSVAFCLLPVPWSPFCALHFNFRCACAICLLPVFIASFLEPLQNLPFAAPQRRRPFVLWRYSLFPKRWRGRERMTRGRGVEHCCLMKIFLRQVFRKDLQHLQKAPATTIKATATTATNDATEVLRISVKWAQREAKQRERERDKVSWGGAQRERGECPLKWNAHFGHKTLNAEVRQ